jgi:hypothetical protein
MNYVDKWTSLYINEKSELSRKLEANKIYFLLMPQKLYVVSSKDLSLAYRIYTRSLGRCEIKQNNG